MFSVVHRISIGAVILLVIPVLTWIFSWTWKLGRYSKWLKLLYWITETVTQPWGIITHILLCIWFLWCLRLKIRQSIILFSILSAAMLAGQGVKFWIKSNVHEPRPFVILLEKTYNISADIFYSLKSEDRRCLIKTHLIHEKNVPYFLYKHWQKETGFSFPSGHTIFSSSWTFLSIGLLWPYRHIATIIILIIWSIGVMGSRLLLGMHWPKDLIVATLISWLLVIFAIWIIELFCCPLISLLKKNKKYH